MTCDMTCDMPHHSVIASLTTVPVRAERREQHCRLIAPHGDGKVAPGKRCLACKNGLRRCRGRTGVPYTP
jgi:hypothetical protein